MLNNLKNKAALLSALLFGAVVQAQAAVPAAIDTMLDDLVTDGGTYISLGVAALVVFTGGYIAMKVAKKVMSKAT